jgi:hypothetical protein
VTGLARYGVTSSTGNYGWSSVRPADQSSTIYRRWDATVDPNASGPTGDFRNEPNQFGWVVRSTLTMRAARPGSALRLGRMNHEGAWPSNFTAGRRPAFLHG